MAASETDFNPFQAPGTRDLPEQRLADDSQFLISGRDIICREKVVLPGLCIHTGEVENLVKRQRILYAPASLPLAIFGVAVCFVLLAMTMGFRGGSITSLAIFALVAGSVANRFWKFLPWSLLNTVDATWYLSGRYLRRVYVLRMVTRIVLVVICGFVGALLGDGFALPPNTGSLLAILVGGIVGFALSFTLQVEQPLTLRGPRYMGPQKGLMALQGHSRHFAENAKRVAAGGFSS